MTALRRDAVGARVLRVLRRRVLQALGVVVAVTGACFAIVQSLPGDQAYRIAAARYGYDNVDGAAADGLRRELGLDASAWQQFGDWLLDAARLDLGVSLVSGASVTDEVGRHLLGTLQLGGAALLLAVLTGVGLGTLAALRAGGLLDRVVSAYVALTRAVPPFLLGLVLIVVFTVQLRLLPSAGHGEATSVVLPALTLAVGLSGLFARVTRDTVADVLASEHVRFAETLGLSRRRLVLRHVVRNCGVTVVAYVGVQALVLVEGVVVVESLFAWNGLGHALVHAVFWRDVPVLQASAMALGLLVVAVNLAVDLATVALDPRPTEREALR